MSRAAAVFSGVLALLLFATIGCASPEQGPDTTAAAAPAPHAAAATAASEAAAPSYASASRVTRAIEVARPRYEEGYEEAAPAEPPAAAAPAETPPAREEPAAAAAAPEDPSEARRKAVIAGNKETALARLGAAAQEDQETVDSLEDLKARKEGRDALSGDLERILPLDDEIEIGKGVAARILHQTPELDDPALWEYVAFVGQAVAASCPRSTLTFYFIVLDSDEVNGFSTPGGFVFITRGAVEFCTNEAELASILAHEVAHIALKHAIRSLDRAKYRFMMKDALAEMDEHVPAPEDEEFQKIVEELTAIGDEFYNMSQNPYSRTLEIEADRDGLRYLAAAGYDPRAAIAVMERFAEEQSSAGGAGVMAHALSSHPEPKERLETLRRALRELGRKSSGQLNPERFQAAVGR